MAIKLATMTSMLNKARDNHYAIAQININNLEWIKAVLTAVQQTNTPVILGVSEGAAKYMCGYKNVVDMVVNCMNTLKITQDVVVHLDHGTYEGCLAALAVGFSSIMFDGSSLPFAENKQKTIELVKLCQQKNVSLECEVGAIGGEEDGTSGSGELADVNQCVEISSLGITCLAAGIGNIHGIYPPNWKGLNLERLKQIHQVTNRIPLVLHGGTGIPDKMVQDAIALGVAKVNVNTECQLAFQAATREYVMANKDIDLKAKGFDPRKFLKPGAEAITAKCIEKFKVFNSIGKQ